MTAVVLAVLVSFAMFVTVHVTGSIALAQRAPRWNGAVALVVPPLFPYYAARRHQVGWAIVWCAAAIAYAVALGVAMSWR
jgi:hypothetical protein